MYNNDSGVDDYDKNNDDGDDDEIIILKQT